MSWLALDIGGANIKAADGVGFARSVAFPLWKHPEDLATALRELFASAPRAESLAVTMTGELADCYETKAEGVESILDAVEAAAEGRTVWVYLCDGRLVSPITARAEALLAAASNWHVLADFAHRYCDEFPALLLDVGSTTCDLIPLDETGPCAIGKTDPSRLASGELVYTGVERSPLCAIVSHLPWRDQPCPVAQEFFATTADAYVMTGELPEDAQNTDTADGRPRTVAFAHARIARMICADATMFSLEEAMRAARVVRDAQTVVLALAAERVIDRMDTPPATIVLSGHGEFLSRRLLKRLDFAGKVVSLTEQLGTARSRAACAHALAVLARERDDV